MRNRRVFSLLLGTTIALWAAPSLGGDRDQSGGTHSGHMRQPGPEADEHPEHKAPLHGGKVFASKEHHFETLFGNDGVRVFLYTGSRAPMMAKKASGKATLKFKGGPQVEINLVRAEPAGKDPAIHFCPMHEDVVQSKTGICTHCGGMKLFVQDFLFGKADLSKIKPGSLEAVVSITGLKGEKSAVAFTVDNSIVEERSKATE